MNIALSSLRHGTIGEPGELEREWTEKHFGILRLIMLERWMLRKKQKYN